MKVSALTALSAATLLATGATSAFAQMNSAEILLRLQKQADSVNTMDVGSNATQRGMALNYGTAEPSPSAAPKLTPSVVAVPAAPIAAVPTIPAAPSFAATPAAAAPSPSFVSIDPSSAVTPTQSLGANVATAPEPVYTIEEKAAPSQAAAAPAYSFSDAVPAVAKSEPILASTASAAVPTADYTTVDEEARVDLRIYFEWNSAALRPDAIGQLAELCTAIQSMSADGANQFKIIGHTDKSGASDYNLYLSRARAREVKRHLIEECSLPENALIATGEGERQSSPSTPSQAPEERRVEVQLVS